MEFQWVAIALGDVTWIAIAFLFGFIARLISLPPLVGFLATGFLLNAFGITSVEMLHKLADLGITLLLFIVGLKLNLRVLAKPQVWSVTIIHIAITVLVFCGLIALVVALGLPLFTSLNFESSLLLAFALSFSSTVFVVKVLEEKGDMNAFHGRIAIGILVMQDLAAVAFLAFSTGKIPSYWALLLFLLIPAKPIIIYFLRKAGHGELLILYGLVLALGGAELFEIAGVKDDLGALIMGVLISSHPKSVEMAKSILSFKDLFLVGFFLSIGLSGELTVEAVIIGVSLVPLVFFKSGLFFLLMTRFKLRARTALLSSINLTNFSEFGLIVVAVSAANQWLSGEWLTVMAIAVSLSFLIAAPLTRRDNGFYSHYKKYWLKVQSDKRLSEDQVIDTCSASIAVFGMGRIGRGAYDQLQKIYGQTIMGVDFDEEKIADHRNEGRFVSLGDPSDADFWELVKGITHLDMVMLALPSLQSNLDVLEQLREIDFQGKIAAIARYQDEVDQLKLAGADAVFNIYTEAGTGFADHAQEALRSNP